MDKIRFSHYVHYNRNHPSQKQSIYFNTSASFNSRLSELILNYEAEANEIEDLEMVDFLTGLSEKIEAEFGLLTIDQTLLVTHTISQRVAYREGYIAGHNKASAGLTLRPSFN